MKIPSFSTIPEYIRSFVRPRQIETEREKTIRFWFALMLSAFVFGCLCIGISLSIWWVQPDTTIAKDDPMFVDPVHAPVVDVYDPARAEKIIKILEERKK
jgi:hypothetical protein